MLQSCWAEPVSRIGSAIIILLLAGCASTPQDCDPAQRDANVLRKAGCVYGGHYQQRVQDKQAILLDEQKANQLFRDAFAALQQESQQVAQDIASQQASVTRMSASVNALLVEIKSRASGNQQIEQQIRTVESQLAGLQQDIESAKARGEALPQLQQRQQMAELQLSVQDLQAALGLR